jgi:hypothetical protein
MTWKPTTKVPFIDITDTGKFLEPILLNPAKYDGKNFTCATASYTPLQLVDGWTKIMGKKVVYEQTDVEKANANLTPEMQRELKKSTGLLDEYHYFGLSGEDDLRWTLAQMKEAPTTWEDFLKVNDSWFNEK